MRRPPGVKLSFLRSHPQDGETPIRHASIRTRRGAPIGARCTLGSDPNGRWHLGNELEGSSSSSQSPGRDGRSFDLLWMFLVSKA